MGRIDGKILRGEGEFDLGNVVFFLLTRQVPCGRLAGGIMFFSQTAGGYLVGMTNQLFVFIPALYTLSFFFATMPLIPNFLAEAKNSVPFASKLSLNRTPLSSGTNRFSMFLLCCNGK
jgi:hypothetical protein